jgi:hypothetical protein
MGKNEKTSFFLTFFQENEEFLGFFRNFSKFFKNIEKNSTNYFSWFKNKGRIK